MSERYLTDNAADRALGEQWEQSFCRLAAWYGKTLYAYQHDRGSASCLQHGARVTLTPDVQMFSDESEGYEIKHKNPTDPRKFPDRRYGWETYRLNHLLDYKRVTSKAIFYAIHDWEAAGSKRADQPMPNLLQDWRLAEIETLATYAKAHLAPEYIKTWVSAERKSVLGYYWPTVVWDRLDVSWGLPR